uniref:Uncharacterized protein n=1 Tax=Tetraselmis sp. GSL018 TaxID=582737 RepID=A0A061R819_9CHLO
MAALATESPVKSGYGQNQGQEDLAVRHSVSGQHTYPRRFTVTITLSLLKSHSGPGIPQAPHPRSATIFGTNWARAGS